MLAAWGFGAVRIHGKEFSALRTKAFERSGLEFFWVLGFGGLRVGGLRV